MMLKKTKRLETPFYAKIKISNLKTGSYQRELNMSRVKKYSNDFDWDIFGVPLVSMRGGEYYVVDGMHRIELLKLMGIDEVMCQVITGLTYEMEAGKFVKLNSERGGLSTNQKFHGRVEGKEPTAMNIVRILNEYGFTYSNKQTVSKDNVIAAIGSIEEIYKRYGSNHLCRTLSILRNTWYGAAGSLKRDIVRGISTFLAETKNVKDDILCSALEHIDPENIILRALVCAGTMGNSGGINNHRCNHVAKAVRDIYNEYKRNISDSCVVYPHIEASCTDALNSTRR